MSSFPPAMQSIYESHFWLPLSKVEPLGNTLQNVLAKNTQLNGTMQYFEYFRVGQFELLNSDRKGTKQR